MVTAMLKECLYLLLIAPVALSLFSNLPGIDRFCSLKKETIQCDIHVVNLLRFNDIRMLISDISDAHDVILNITCASTGEVQMSWPMKSRNIKELWIHGCHINGFYFKTYVKMSDIPDKLLSLAIENSVIETNIFNALKIFSNEVSKGLECGQLTLNTFIMRNISYKFVLEPNDVSNLETNGVLVDLGDVAIEDKSSSIYHCIYKHLEVIDISKSSDGMTHFILPFENSEYPNLTLFNMSNSRIISYPDLFRTWEDLFPNLEILDLSGNAIHNFSVTSNAAIVNKRTNPLFVNLRDNQFEYVPSIIKHILQRRIPLVVDLSENPLKCGCDTLLYKDYLIRLLTTYDNFDSLRDATCLQLYGKTIPILDLGDLNC